MFRACLTSLGIHEETARFAVAIRLRDDVDMQLRTRLNSRQVIAGDTGLIPAGVHPPSASKLEWPNACTRRAQ